MPFVFDKRQVPFDGQQYFLKNNETGRMPQKNYKKMTETTNGEPVKEAKIQKPKHIKTEITGLPRNDPA